MPPIASTTSKRGREAGHKQRENKIEKVSDTIHDIRAVWSRSCADVITGCAVSRDVAEQCKAKADRTAAEEKDEKEGYGRRCRCVCPTFLMCASQSTRNGLTVAGPVHSAQRPHWAQSHQSGATQLNKDKTNNRNKHEGRKKKR